MFRAVAASVVLVFTTNVAGAQITTYMAPPRPLAPTPRMVAAADSTHKDSVAQVAMTNMKAWVDSAAGVTVSPRVGTDSSALVNDPGRPEPVVTTFSNGIVAPATASELPALALFGIIALGAGAALLTKRPRG